MTINHSKQNASSYATLAEKLGAVLVRRNTDLRVVQVAPLIA